MKISVAGWFWLCYVAGLGYIAVRVLSGGAA